MVLQKATYTVPRENPQWLKKRTPKYIRKKREWGHLSVGIHRQLCLWNSAITSVRHGTSRHTSHHFPPDQAAFLQFTGVFFGAPPSLLWSSYSSSSSSIGLMLMLLCRGLQPPSTRHWAPDYDFLLDYHHPNSCFFFSSFVLCSFLQCLHLQHVVAIQEACGWVWTVSTRQKVTSALT